MKIECRICGNQFDFPDGKRGKRPVICKSDACIKEKRRQDNLRFRDKQTDKEKTPKADLSKAGWPPDTKRCQRCGKLFISDSKSRVCPVCLSDEPLPKQLDDSLAKAKEAGFEPEDYGKFKAAKTLAGLEPIDVGLAAKVREIGRDIDAMTKMAEDVIVEEVRPEYIVRGRIVDIEEAEERAMVYAETEPQSQHQCDTCKPTSNHDFICALEDLMDMADKWNMDPDKVYPLAEDILKKGIMKHPDEARR